MWADCALSQDAVGRFRCQLVEDAPAGASWFARVEVKNFVGKYNATETVPTEHGDVLVEYMTTLPYAKNDPGSADTACVVSLPDGIIANPACVDILETETESIYLFQFLGG
jgi:hypothetical protein